VIIGFVRRWALLICAEGIPVAGPVDNCGGCRFFLPRKPLPKGVSAPTAFDMKVGKCRRFPIEAEKREDDWCGEFERRKA
jgi:hypothetical protein